MGNGITKQYVLRFSRSNPDSVFSFKALRVGSKKIETRAATPKYRRINIGDKLIFRCGDEKFEKRVSRVKVFKNINEMLRVHRVKDIMPNRASKKELVDAYHSFLGYKEKITKHGLVAWELK